MNGAVGSQLLGISGDYEADLGLPDGLCDCLERSFWSIWRLEGDDGSHRQRPA